MKLSFWILVFCQFVAGKCFLLGTSNVTVSPTSPIATELQQILNIFHNETAQLQHYVANLETKMISVETALQQKLNKSEEQVSKLTAELHSEKTKRIQLQRDSDDLLFKFFNLSSGHNAVVSKTNLLQNENKVLRKDVQNLTSVLSGVNFSSIMLDHADLLRFKQKQGFNMGFSASYPSNASATDTVTFTNVTTNTGNFYDSSSGKFTCSVPGLYYFSLTIVKMNDADHAWCYIRKNGQHIVQSGISGIYGWIGATNSVILHLQQGDSVDVGGCSAANSPNSTMFTDSSFTGFLVKVD